MARMCPVDIVCHQLTCHWRLFSLSRMRNGCFFALFTPIDFAISAKPTSEGTLFTYLWYSWRQSWRCVKYLNSVYVAVFHEILLWLRARSPVLTVDDGRHQFTMCCAVVSLNSQKLLSCATGVRLRVTFSLTVVVTIRVRISVSVYGYGSAWSYGFALKLKGKRHRTFWWKIKTRLLSTPPLISFPHAIDIYVSGGRGSHYVNKDGK